MCIARANIVNPKGITAHKSNLNFRLMSEILSPYLDEKFEGEVVKELENLVSK